MCAAAAVGAAAVTAATGSGCSRVERVKIVSRFGQPVRVRLNGKDTSPLVPARSETVLDGTFYLGSRGVRLTILSADGRVLREESVIQIPGDSAFRAMAVIEVGP